MKASHLFPASSMGAQNSRDNPSMSSFEPAALRMAPIWIGALTLAVLHTLAAQPASRLTLELADYAQMPITGELDGQNTRGQLARVNFLREEPGGPSTTLGAGRRLFVNDLNGPLYILDKQTKTFVTYLDLN